MNGKAPTYCVVALLALSGCVVGPEYKPPPAPKGAAAAFQSTTPELETDSEPPDDWWQLYRDPQLEQLLSQAMAANTNLRVAAASLSAARALLQAARAGHYPQTDLGMGGVYGRDPATDEVFELTGRQPSDTWVFDPLLDTSYEIDLFGRVRRAIEAAHADVDAVAATRDEVKITVIAETTRAYTQLCALGEQLEVAHHSLTVVSHEARITQDRHTAGAGSQFDVVRAQGLVAQVGAHIPALEGQRRAALYELTALIGRPPSRVPDVDRCVTLPQLASLMPVGNGATLLQRRPDVHAAERRLAAATANIGVATADLYPRITLKGFFGAVAPTLNGIATDAGLAWGIGPGVSWTFPDQAIPRARVQQASAGADAALAAFDGVVLQALKETEQALSRYSSDLRRHQLLLAAQDSAHRALDIADHQFVAGALTNLDLLTSEEGQVQTDAAVADSDGELVQDQVAIFKALGGGWQPGQALSATNTVGEHR
jgi:NodT family efflux transporter outer membrane factor (OMF) lipoprotein